MRLKFTRLASPRSAIVAALALVLIAFIIAGIESPKGSFGHSPPIWVGLDLKSSGQIYAAVEEYGAGGRQAIQTVLLLDVLYAAAWALLLGSIIVLSCRFLFANKPSVTRFFALFPVIGFILDELQNISISVLLNKFPERIEWLAELSSFLSVGLWFCVYSSIALALIGIAASGFWATIGSAKQKRQAKREESG